MQGRARTSDRERRGEDSDPSVHGAILCVCIIVLVIGLLMLIDGMGRGTTVGDVHNIGLLQQKTQQVTIGAVASAVGALGLVMVLTRQK